MSFKEKYLKYKKKYNLLKSNFLIFNLKNLAIDTGLAKIVDIPKSPSCSKNIVLFSTNNILDLDCLRLSLETKKLIPKLCLDIIRDNIQDYFDDFYNYLCFPQRYGPEIGFDYDDYNRYVKPVNSTLEYTFPIINIPGREFMGTVDYDYFINKLVIDNDFKSLCFLFNDFANLILLWLNRLNIIFYLNFTNIQLLDLFKICKQLVNNYKEKIDVGLYDTLNLYINYLEHFYSFTSLYYLSQLVILIYNKMVINIKGLNLKGNVHTFLKISQSIINFNLPYLKNSSGITDLIFGFNTLYGIDKLRTSNYNSLETATKLRELVEFKRKNVVQLILDSFEKGKTNKMVVHLLLRFYTDFKTLKTEGHSNSLVIYKYQDNTYLVIRTEPHRHTNIYCRPSMRKAIRELFKEHKNFFYKDYVINNPYRIGVQVYEEKKTEIDFKNETDFDKLLPKYKIISPLQGNSGFCASWTMYTTMILLLNHDKNLKSIGDYLGSFFLESDDIDNYDTLYTLYKHIKLYRSVLFVLCFLYRTFGESKFKSIFLAGLIRSGATNKDTELVLSLVKDCMPQFNHFDTILKSLNKIPVSKPDMTNFDPHYCTDSLFNHRDMCLMNDITKTITPKQKEDFKCNDTNITLIGVKQAHMNEKKHNRDAYEKMLKSRKNTRVSGNEPSGKWQEQSSIAEAIKNASNN
jgi:hypothetical protein